MPDVRVKKLSTGHVSVFNPATQELLLVPPDAVGELASADRSNAWGKAVSLAASGRAQRYSQRDLQAVQESMSYCVLLQGSNDWPP